MASNGIIPAVQFARALEAAGVVSDLDTITRIVIDVDPSDLVKIYVERVAGPRIEDIAGLLGEMMRDGRAENPAAPKGVRYWSTFAVELLDDENVMCALGERGIRVVDRMAGPGRAPGMRLVLIEDDGAPEELAGREVALTFFTEGGNRTVKREVMT